MLVIKAEIHKMLVSQKADRKDHDQTASDQGLHCLSRPENNPITQNKPHDNMLYLSLPP